MIYEGELRARVDHQAAVDLVRWERTAQQQVAFRAAVEEQKAQIAAAKAQQAARPCADCGRPEAAGRCMTCSLLRETTGLVEKAVDIAVAMWAEVDDPQALVELTAQVRQDTWAFVRRAEVPGGADDLTSRVYTERELAKRVLAHRHQRAWERLRESEPAEIEATHVKRMALRGMFLTDKNLKRVQKAAQWARDRVAKELLGEFLADLYRARAAAVPQEPVVAWSGRCAELAARPLAPHTVAQPQPIGAPRPGCPPPTRPPLGPAIPPADWRCPF
ncbi:hypothetical protein ACWCQZ_45950 [Streptomyces sp. NPDC002285]